MSAQAVSETSGLLAAYREHPARGRYDEIAGPDGIRDHQEPLAATIESLGLGGLLAARAEARGFVVDEGVVYGSPEQRTSRLWNIDPLPAVLDTDEWTRLAAALDQRSRLLDLILTDLYTERSLLRRRVVPAAAILSHPGFVRPADHVLAPHGRQLLLTATDLGRSASGSWQVISDRPQAPYGSGYAMVTRRIVSRVMAGLHRGSDLARLRGFFHAMTTALLDTAPRHSDNPRVVVLSPGAESETAFDTSFLSTMLGFPVAEADDLITSHGRVWLRAGQRLEPVDVVLRRVPAMMADPLELRGNSGVGVPGLIEAARNGQVAIANPVGAGVLDNPALLAYLEPAAQALLDEPLLLRSPATWWCGEPSGLSHVLANLDRLVIKPTTRGVAPVTYGWELADRARDGLAARLRAEPWQWCGQEPLELSTAPVVCADGLEPRRFVLRTFGVATGSDYTFLPGGLGRVAGTTGERTVTSRTGLAKDVWVASGAMPPEPRVPPRPRLVVTPAPARVAPRVAGTLFEIGGRAEQAEATARLTRMADDLAEDHSSRLGSPGALAMTALVRAVIAETGIESLPEETRVDYLRRTVLDPVPGSVLAQAVALIDAAQDVRDLLSVDTWSVFGRLEHTLDRDLEPDDQLQPLLDDVLESLLAFAGIAAQNMVRDESWAFLDAGGRLARAVRTVGLLRRTLADPPAGEAGDLVAESVLRACESIITHRRRAVAGTGPSEPRDSAFVLLIQDESNPRSVAHQLAALAADLRLIGDDALASFAEELRGRLGEQPSLEPAEWLDTLTAELTGLAARIAARHFVPQATRHLADAFSRNRGW